MKIKLFIAFLTASLVLSESVNICNSDSDCLPDNYCSTESHCKHSEEIKLDSTKLFFFGLMLVAGILSNTCSIQGGSIALPIYILAFHFSVVEAIAIIKCLNMIGNTVYFALNVNQRREDNSFATDYNFVFLMTPIILIGAFYGVSISIALPGWILMLICLILLSFSIYKNIKKAKSKMKEEQEGVQEIPRNSQVIEMQDRSTEEHISRQIANKSQISKIKGEFPYFKFLFTAFVVLTMSLVKFAAGSKEKDSLIGIETCSVSYWLIFVSVVPLAAIFTGIAYVFVQKEQNILEQCNYSYPRHEIKWSRTKLLSVSSTVLSVSLLSSSVGPGGGLLIMPMMLELGFDVIGAGNTNNCIQMLREGSQALYFYVEGKVMLPWVLLFSVNSVIGAIVGSFLRKYFIRQNKISWVIWILTGTLFVACILIGLLSYIKLERKIDRGISILAFHSIC